MSTWTSSAALAGAALALAACDTARPGGPPAREAVVAGGAVVVKAPPGYCVDRSAVRDSASGSFVMLASCASLAPESDGPRALPALMTVSVSAADPALAPPDAAALAAAAPVEVLAARQRGALALAHLAEGGGEVLPGGDPRHWRGAARAGERVVGLALYAPDESPLAGEAGANLLAALAARIETRAVAPAEAPEPQGVGAMLAGLFD